MKRFFGNYFNINKFSRNVIKVFLIISVAVSLCGIVFLKNSTTYYYIFLSRKIIETGFCFLVLAFSLGFLTDYLYKTGL